MPGRDRIAAAAIAATLAISALAVGSATRSTALVAAALGLGCSAIYARSHGGLRGRPALLQLVGLALGLTALQLIPLPLAVLDALGAKAELLAANARALDREPPGFSPLSYDPAATWLELAKLIGYLGFAACCMRVARTPRGRRRIAAAIAGVGAAVAATAALHELAGAGALFGIYRPRHIESPVLLAPFLNPNHLAGFLALTTPVAVALAIAERERRRLLWIACAGLSAAIAALTQSRTGAVSMLVGAVAVAALAAPLARRRRRPMLGSNRVAIALIAITGAVVAALTVGRGAIDELARTDTGELTGERGKVALWADAAALLWDNRLAGVGRGAFEFATPSSEDNLTFSHVENGYLQALVDWGLVGGLLVWLGLVLAARVAAGRVRGSVVEAGLGAGLLAFAVHQLADFTIELPGAALAAIAGFAVLARAPIDAVGPAHRRRRIAALVLGALGIAAAASPLATGARAETDALAADFRDRDPRGALEPALAVWRRHPGDFTAAAQVAGALLARRDRRAAAVINRALRLNPGHPGLHRIAARMLLASKNPTQALIEYRAAIARARDRPAVIRELVAAFPDPGTAARGLPLEARFAGSVLAALARLEAHQLGFAYTSALVERYPDSGRFHAARAYHALVTDRPEAAVESARVALRRGRRGAELALARALLAAGEPAEAEAVLTGRRETVRPRGQIVAELQVLARAQTAQQKHADAIDSLRAAIELRGPDRDESAPLYRQLARSQQAAGRPSAARVSLERAAWLEQRRE